MPVSPGGILRCLAGASQTLKKLHLSNHLEPSKIKDGKEFPLVESLSGFPGLRQVAIDTRCIERTPGRNPSTALAALVAGCAELEGLYLMGIDEFPLDEFKVLADKVAELEWPHLRRVKLRSKKSPFQPFVRVRQQVDRGNPWKLMEKALTGPAERDVKRMAEAAGVKVVALSGDVRHGEAFAA